MRIHPRRSPDPDSTHFHLGYRPALDGVRAIAVLMVMAWHFHLPGWNGGFLGVDVFFVLSGFLITTLLVEEWQTNGSIRLRRFYLRRALRLFPALFVLLIVTAPFVSNTWTLVALGYVANWAMALGYVWISPISHLWSLAVEEHFYLLWPGLLTGLLRLRAPRLAVIGVVGLLAAGSAAEKVILWVSTASWIRLYHGTDTRADALLVGCGLGLLVGWGMLPKTTLFRICVRAAALPALVGFGLLTVTASIDGQFMYQRAGLSLAALAVGILLLQIVIAPIRPVAALLEWPLLVGIGRISYGLYLWHHPIAWIPNPWIFGTLNPTTLFVAKVALSFAAAGISYVAIERPALRLKLRYANRSIVKT